jgi:hypothetical protein
MKLVTYSRMDHPPRLVVVMALLKYMKPNEIEALKVDLAKLKTVTDRLLVDRFRKYLDLERLRVQPIIPEDIMVYNYLQYEFTGKFRKTKLLAKYGREVMRGQIAAIQEMRGILSDLKIDY